MDENTRGAHPGSDLGDEVDQGAEGLGGDLGRRLGEEGGPVGLRVGRNPGNLGDGIPDTGDVTYPAPIGETPDM